MGADEWARLERGLEQRLRALGLFLDDVYGEQQRSSRARSMPARDGARRRSATCRILRGISPPGGVRIHIAGVDLIRDPDGHLRVLEDNLRTPSGVSYVVENRLITKRIFPHVFDVARRAPRRPLPDAPRRDAALGLARSDPEEATVVVLTPGPYNSAYFEHSFLARTMGLELVQAPRPRSSTATRSSCARRAARGASTSSTAAPTTRSSIPRCSAPTACSASPASCAPAAGQRGARERARQRRRRRQGDLSLRARHDPLLPGRGADPRAGADLRVRARATIAQYVLEHLAELVVKAVDEAGGYGMLMGPQATRRRARRVPRAHRRPSRAATSPSTASSCRPARPGSPKRAASSRGASTCGRTSSTSRARGAVGVLPGGLTRVALREGSYVVNSSQGGGSKDTWVR